MHREGEHIGSDQVPSNLEAAGAGDDVLGIVGSASPDDRCHWPQSAAYEAVTEARWHSDDLGALRVQLQRTLVSAAWVEQLKFCAAFDHRKPLGHPAVEVVPPANAWARASDDIEFAEGIVRKQLGGVEGHVEGAALVLRAPTAAHFHLVD